MTTATRLPANVCGMTSSTSARSIGVDRGANEIELFVEGDPPTAIPSAIEDNLRSNAQFAPDPDDAALERFLKSISVYAVDARSRLCLGLFGNHG